MTATLADHLRAFLHPKRTDEAALRTVLDAVPRPLRPRFAREARRRLAALERTFRPLGEYDGADIRGPAFPTVTFESEEQVYQVAAAAEAIRRKRRLLDDWAGHGRGGLR